jgi:hypothetical protein
MKYSKILSASLCLAYAIAFTPIASAEEPVPIELLNFAKENGVELSKPLAAAVVNKYPLAGKTLTLTGKLSISGSASYKGHTFPFAAPGKNMPVQSVTYTFEQTQKDGSIPFQLNHLGGVFGGVMTPTAKADKYELKMNDPEGSLLSSISLYARQSGTNIWTNTLYSYTAATTQKKVRGVTTTYLEVKEKAGFKITMPVAYGGNAVAKYTYSYDWKGALK